MIGKQLNQLNRSELKEYIFSLQLEVQKEVSNHNNIDDFLDNTDIFDKFEDILPEQEFGIFILTILNNFKSKVILNDLLDIVEKAIENN